MEGGVERIVIVSQNVLGANINNTKVMKRAKLRVKNN